MCTLACFVMLTMLNMTMQDTSYTNAIYFERATNTAHIKSPCAASIALGSLKSCSVRTLPRFLAFLMAKPSFIEIHLLTLLCSSHKQCNNASAGTEWNGAYIYICVRMYVCMCVWDCITQKTYLLHIEQLMMQVHMHLIHTTLMQYHATQHDNCCNCVPRPSPSHAPSSCGWPQRPWGTSYCSACRRWSCGRQCHHRCRTIRHLRILSQRSPEQCLKYKVLTDAAVPINTMMLYHTKQCVSNTKANNEHEPSRVNMMFLNMIIHMMMQYHTKHCANNAKVLGTSLPVHLFNEELLVHPMLLENVLRDVVVLVCCVAAQNTHYARSQICANNTHSAHMCKQHHIGKQSSTHADDTAMLCLAMVTIT